MAASRRTVVGGCTTQSAYRAERSVAGPSEGGPGEGGGEGSLGSAEEAGSVSQEGGRGGAARRDKGEACRRKAKERLERQTRTAWCSRQVARVNHHSKTTVVQAVPNKLVISQG